MYNFLSVGGFTEVGFTRSLRARPAVGKQSGPLFFSSLSAAPALREPAFHGAEIAGQQRDVDAQVRDGHARFPRQPFEQGNPPRVFLQDGQYGRAIRPVTGTAGCGKFHRVRPGDL